MEARGDGRGNGPPAGEARDGAAASPPACRDGGPPRKPTGPPPPRGGENAEGGGTARCRWRRSMAPNSPARPPPRGGNPVVGRDHRADGASAKGSQFGARRRAHPTPRSLVAAGLTADSPSRRRKDHLREPRIEDRRSRREAPMMPNTRRTGPGFLPAMAARNVDRDPETALQQRRSTCPPYARRVW